jgi:hypothetical protein
VNGVDGAQMAILFIGRSGSEGITLP